MDTEKNFNKKKLTQALINLKSNNLKIKFTNAEYLSKNGFYLPSGLGIRNSDIDIVGKTLIKILHVKSLLKCL